MVSLDGLFFLFNIPFCCGSLVFGLEWCCWLVSWFRIVFLVVFCLPRSDCFLFGMMFWLCLFWDGVRCCLAWNGVLSYFSSEKCFWCWFWVWTRVLCRFLFGMFFCCLVWNEDVSWGLIVIWSLTGGFHGLVLLGKKGGCGLFLRFMIALWRFSMRPLWVFYGALFSRLIRLTVAFCMLVDSKVSSVWNEFAVDSSSLVSWVIDFQMFSDYSLCFRLFKALSSEGRPMFTGGLVSLGTSDIAGRQDFLEAFMKIPKKWRDPGNSQKTLEVLRRSISRPRDVSEPSASSLVDGVDGIRGFEERAQELRKGFFEAGMVCFGSGFLLRYLDASCQDVGMENRKRYVFSCSTFWGNIIANFRAKMKKVVK